MKSSVHTLLEIQSILWSDEEGNTKLSVGLITDSFKKVVLDRSIFYIR